MPGRARGRIGCRVCLSPLFLLLLSVVGAVACLGAADPLRELRASLREIESRLQANLPPDEEARLLWELAERSRIVGDITRTRFALSRLRKSPAWPNFPYRRDALLQAALLEESQSRFGPAAELYGQIVQEEIPRPSRITMETAYAGYALRWADCLEKAGDSRRAAKIYWDLVENLPATQRRLVLLRLIHNYRYGMPPQEEISRLSEWVHQSGGTVLLWNLAQLYGTKGMFRAAAELFEELWNEQPAVAVNYVDEMIAAFEQTGRLEKFLKEAQLDVSDRTVALFLATAYQHLGAPEKALEVITRCQAAVANALLAAGSVESATGLSPLPSDPIDLTPELNELEYQALRAVGNATAAYKLAVGMCRRQPRNAEWYEAASRLPGMDVVSLWRSYVEANNRRAHAYQRAAQSLSELGFSDESLSFLAEGARQSPGLLSVMAYADALISSGSVEAAWQEYKRIVDRNWAPDGYLTQHVPDILERSSVKEAVRIMLEPHLQRPPTLSWEDRVLRDLLVEAGEVDRLLDWVSSDPSGLAATDLAQWALRKGKTDLALAAYESVPVDSLYRDTARIQMARILRDSGIQDRHTLNYVAGLLAPIVERLSFRPDEPKGARQMKLEIVELWARVQLSAGEGLEVLTRLRQLFGEAREALLHEYEPDAADRILLLRGLALSQVGSLADAILEFRAVSEWSVASAEAAFYEGQCLFWQEEFEAAESIFEQIVTDPAAWRLANDALEYLSFLRSLGRESLQLLSEATFLAWQGRWENAVSLFQDLAVREYGQDVGEWAQYMVGKVLWNAGQVDRAVAEWKRLSQEGSYGWLRDRVAWEMASGFPVPASPEIERERLLHDILSSEKESLFGDLARLQLRLGGMTGRRLPTPARGDV